MAYLPYFNGAQPLVAGHLPLRSVDKTAWPFLVAMPMQGPLSLGLVRYFSSQYSQYWLYAPHMLQKTTVRYCFILCEWWQSMMPSGCTSSQCRGPGGAGGWSSSDMASMSGWASG